MPIITGYFRVRDRATPFHRREGRSTPDLLGCDVGATSAEPFVVSELLPRDGVVMFPESEEASERYVGVQNFPAHLLDHQPPDGPDAAPRRIVHRRTFHAVTFDDWFGGPVIRETEAVFEHAGSGHRFANPGGPLSLRG